MFSCHAFLWQPTGEGGATRAPICIDLARDSSLSSKSIILQIDSKNQQVSASEASCQTAIHLFSIDNTAPYVCVCTCARHWVSVYINRTLWILLYWTLWKWSFDGCVLVVLFFFCPITGALRHSLQDRLSKSSGKSRDEIYLKLRTSTG